MFCDLYMFRNNLEVLFLYFCKWINKLSLTLFVPCNVGKYSDLILRPHLSQKVEKRASKDGSASSARVARRTKHYLGGPPLQCTDWSTLQVRSNSSSSVVGCMKMWPMLVIAQLYDDKMCPLKIKFYIWALFW